MTIGNIIIEQNFLIAELSYCRTFLLQNFLIAELSYCRTFLLQNFPTTELSFWSHAWLTFDIQRKHMPDETWTEGRRREWLRCWHSCSSLTPSVIHYYHNCQWSCILCTVNPFRVFNLAPQYCSASHVKVKRVNKMINTGGSSSLLNKLS